MRGFRTWLCAVVVLITVAQAWGQGQQPNSQTPTFRVTSRLVFLDVTVLDRKGRPVTGGLARDDFLITEDKRPQPIFSFEAPDVHTLQPAARSGGGVPVTIFVLDLLNSRFEDFAYIRYEVEKYLAKEPSQMRSPAEMMVVSNDSLEMVQGFTRSKEELLTALHHIPAALPYKMMSGSFWQERFVQSLDALQQIALQNQGLPGRKNVIWVGHGGPSINVNFFPASVVQKINGYVHGTVNMLVDARISLFVIYPGLSLGAGPEISEGDAYADPGDTDPFAGDINFGIFVNETGGKLFYNRNDIDSEIRESKLLGSEYYTLTYQPHGGVDNGRFRRIRVTMRDPNLHALTKVGYYAPDAKEKIDPRQQRLINLSDAVHSTLAFSSLNLNIGGIERHPDAQSAQFTVHLHPSHLGWATGDDGKHHAMVYLAAASLNGDGQVLASRLSAYELTLAEDPATVAEKTFAIPVTVRVPRKTRRVRVVVETDEGGRMGTAQLERAAIEAAPAAPTPEPQLDMRQSGTGKSGATGTP